MELGNSWKTTAWKKDCREADCNWTTVTYLSLQKKKKKPNLDKTAYLVICLVLFACKTSMEKQIMHCSVLTVPWDFIWPLMAGLATESKAMALTGLKEIKQAKKGRNGHWKPQGEKKKKRTERQEIFREEIKSSSTLSSISAFEIWGICFY